MERLRKIPARIVSQFRSRFPEFTAKLPAFDLELAGVGAFPNAQRPRTIWLGVANGRDEMIAMHEALEDSLADLGFRPEGRRFTPHLTLGRVKQSSQPCGDLAELLAKHDRFVTGKLPVDEVAIVSSKLGRDGPVYTMLGHTGLA